MAQYPYNYANPYGYQQPMMNYQPMDRLSQLQQNYQNTMPQYQQPQMPQPQMYGLNGEVVDGIDVVKAKNVDMTGAVVYYPQSNGEAIFTKQLQPDGTSRILTYRIEDAPKQLAQQPMSQDILNEMLGQLRNDLLNEINGVKEMVGTLVPLSTEPYKDKRGGNQR